MEGEGGWINWILCDQLLLEIFHRLPPSSAVSVSLVCRRWLALLRSSKTSLSLRLPLFTSASFTSVLSLYPNLCSLTITSSSSSDESDQLLCSIASVNLHLRHLRFLGGPVSPEVLTSVSTSFSHLISLQFSSLRYHSFHWIKFFPSLKDLAIFDCRHNSNKYDSSIEEFSYDLHSSIEEFPCDLRIESLYLSGIGTGNCGLGWLWRSCKNLRRLQLCGCEGIGDGDSSLSFVNCLENLQELELRTCRSIADEVLFLVALNCQFLSSLLLYDGGSREGLHRFIRNCRSNSLQRIDLRLPLDLRNDHLSAIADNFRNLVSLRLQSCCLVTGEGLKSLACAMNSALEELVLVNCDVIERESGLLTTIGQNLRKLLRLDLSFNELLLDRELGSMLSSCTSLINIKLKGCRSLTGSFVVYMVKSCRHLEGIDISICPNISSQTVESIILNSPRLNRIIVEEEKISDFVKSWAYKKAIQVG